MTSPPPKTPAAQRTGAAPARRPAAGGVPGLPLAPAAAVSPGVPPSPGPLPGEGGTQASWPQPPAPEDIYISVTLDVEPVPKTRARISPAEYTQIGAHRVQIKKAHGYSPQSLKQFQERVGWLLKQAKARRNEVDDLGVRAVFYVRGNQRRDLDNLVKSLLDGCNGIAWRDDQQVTRLTADVVRDSDHPRIDLLVFVVTRKARNCQRCSKALTYKQISLGQVFCSKVCYDTDQRKGTYRACIGCGAAVYRQAGKATATEVYCSPDCRAARRGKCRQCGEPNNAAPSNARFCSTECSVAWHRQRALAATSRPAGTCLDCGGPTYSVKSKRCRGCFIAHRSASGPRRNPGPSYDTCPDCGGQKRATSERCLECFRSAAAMKVVGPWKAVS